MISPFFGFPFFPYYGFSYGPVVAPFYSEPVYSTPAYITRSEIDTTYQDQTTNDLRAQVQQLRNEVQQLQAELQNVTGQPVQQSATPQQPPSVTLILKDGKRVEAPGYALVGSTLWILDANKATKVPLSDVDVDATQKENAKRGVNIVIPSQ